MGELGGGGGVTPIILENRSKAFIGWGQDGGGGGRGSGLKGGVFAKFGTGFKNITLELWQPKGYTEE